jgi:tetratricopeptide (TPR) repeat protein
MPLPKFIKIISLFLLSLTLFGCATTGSSNQKVDANVESAIIDIPDEAAIDFKLAIEHMNNKNQDLAEAAFLKMIQDYPMLAGPYANLGVIYSQNKEWNKAQEMLKKSSDKNNKNIKVLNQLGYVYRQKGDFKNAEIQYLKAIELAPKDGAGYLNVGILYDMYMGHFVKASQFYQQYQSLLDTPDRRIAGWIVDINRRSGIMTKKTQIASEVLQ